MSRFYIISLLLVVTVIMVCVSDKKSPKIDIELTTTTPVVEVDQALHFSVSLVNRGKRSVTLVQPGDGSRVGWRTLIISWSVINTDGPLMDRASVGRCGNINTLDKNEVFTIAPGEKIKLNCCRCALTLSEGFSHWLIFQDGSPFADDPENAVWRLGDIG